MKVCFPQPIKSAIDRNIAAEVGEDPSVLALQSVGAALIGFMAAIGWWDTSNKRRLLDNVTQVAEVEALRVLAEPITALLTLPIAFVSVAYWELGWLTYPLFAFLLKRSRWFARS